MNVVVIQLPFSTRVQLSKEIDKVENGFLLVWSWFHGEFTRHCVKKLCIMKRNGF
jgi:hypothetical protein